jgi:GNAT superfamily N-acetyltransferase
VSTVEIRDLDRQDEAQIRAVWEVVRDSVAQRPYNTWLAWAAARAYLVEPPDDSEVATLCAWHGDRVVAVALMSAPRHDNLHRSFVSIHVHPDQRRQGIGSRLVEESLRQSREWGRAVLGSEAYAPVDAESPGSSFAARHGFAVALEDGMKIADLQTTQDRWPALAAEAAAYHQDYRLVTTWDPIPDNLVEAYCTLNAQFFSLAPTGDSDVEDEVWDVARVRERERRGALVGRRDLYTLAFAATGEPAGMTELFINENAAHRVFQGGTLVLPAHQGHRLGIATKAASYLALMERFPDAEWIVTGNADVNAPMNAVNERFGFRIVERCLEVERTV